MVPVCTCVFVSQNLVGIIIYRISSLFHSTNVHIPGLHWWRGGGGGGAKEALDTRLVQPYFITCARVGGL